MRRSKYEDLAGDFVNRLSPRAKEWAVEEFASLGRQIEPADVVGLFREVGNLTTKARKILSHLEHDIVEGLQIGEWDAKGVPFDGKTQTLIPRGNWFLQVEIDFRKNAVSFDSGRLKYFEVSILPGERKLDGIDPRTGSKVPRPRGRPISKTGPYVERYFAICRDGGERITVNYATAGELLKWGRDMKLVTNGEIAGEPTKEAIIKAIEARLGKDSPTK
ncbi:hypothetical protein [Ferrovibrio sp.]|uniref:hypothetical protein n=1 Tax=Ferrovibrio sp. TaxID=1917215 RepID=UPI0035B2D661